MSDEERRYLYKAAVTKVTDGDTVKLDVFTKTVPQDVGFGQVLSASSDYADTFRLADIDTWELFKHKKGTPERARGIAARECAAKWLARMAGVGVELRGEATLAIETVKDKQGKYGRYLVRFGHGGECLLSAHLRSHGHEKVRGEDGHELTVAEMAARHPGT